MKMGMTFEWMMENGSIGNSCMCSDMTSNDYSRSYAAYNFIIIILALPALAAFGLVSNFANVTVFTRPALRTSGNAYLLALAVSDFFLVVTVSLVFWVDSARSYMPFLKNSPTLVVQILPFSYIAQTFSIYLTVFAAVDCFVSTCMPRLARSWCKMKTANCIIVIVLLGSLIYNFPRFIQLGLHDCSYNNETLIEICPSDQNFEMDLVYNVYTYMVVMAFFPFVLLLGLNTIIIITVFRAKQSSAIHGGAPAAAGGDTTTLVMVVILFLSCNTLGLVINIIQGFFDTGILLINFLTDTSNFLVIFNSSVNFVIYITFMKEYRMTFRQLLSGYRSSLFPQPSRRRFRHSNAQISSSLRHQPDGYTLVATTNGVRPYTSQVSTAMI